MHLYTELRLRESRTPWVVGHCIMHFNKSRIREYQYLRTHTYIINKPLFYITSCIVILCRLHYFGCNKKKCLTTRNLGNLPIHLYIILYEFIII